MVVPNRKKETYDYSIKVKKIYNNRVFSNIPIIGFSDSLFSFIPYSLENIEKTLNRQSTKVVNEYNDEYAKERAFLFAEGYNSIGFESYSKDEKVNYEPGSSNKFFSHYTIPSFPCCVMKNIGKTIAVNQNKYYKEESEKKKNFLKNNPNNNYDYYDFNYSDMINTIVSNSLRDMTNTLSSKDIISAFHDSIPQKSFEKLLPLIEHFAYNYKDKHLSNNTLNPYELIFPLFYILNDFLEYAHEDETLEEYLNDDSILFNISRKYNNCEFNEYSNTDKIIENFILPDRIFSLNIIVHSSYRRILISQSKKSLLVLLDFNSPVQIPKNASSNVVSSKMKKVFDCINLMLFFDLDKNTKHKNDLIFSTFRDDIIGSNSYLYKNIVSTIHKYYPKVSTKSNSQYNKEVRKYANFICSLKKEEYFTIVNLIEKTEKINKNIDFSHLLILAYATRYPKPLGYNSSAIILIIIDYLLTESNYDIDFACDIILHLTTNVVFSEINNDSWQTIASLYKENGSSINMKHIIRILSREKERNVNQPLHENSFLNDIIDKYTEYRPSIQW